MIKKALGMIRKCEQRSDIESKEVVKQCPKCLSVLKRGVQGENCFQFCSESTPFYSENYLGSFRGQFGDHSKVEIISGAVQASSEDYEISRALGECSGNARGIVSWH